MTHYNGESNWKGGHRWVTSYDHFNWEYHDAPPIWGIRAGEKFMNGNPVEPYNPMLEMLKAPMPVPKILMTEAEYKLLMEIE